MCYSVCFTICDKTVDNPVNVPGYVLNVSLNIIWPNCIPSSDMDIKNKPLEYMMYFLTCIKYELNIPVCITNDLSELEKTALL